MPGAVELLILILGAGRLLRLVGWDEFPLAAKLRAKVIGEEWVSEIPRGDPMGESPFTTPIMEEIGTGRVVPYEELGLPGKQPHSEVSDVRPAYRRPTLAHLVHCPFCMGWWISLAATLAWYAEPKWTMYVLLPFAVSNAVGLIAKVLDA